MTGLEIAASFAVSVLANNAPTIKDLVSNPQLEKRVRNCYDSARKEWKNQVVREKYKKEAFLHLEELRSFVIDKKGIIDTELHELISRWVRKMQNDLVCATYLESWKTDELLSRTRELPLLASEIIEAKQRLIIHITDMEDTLERQADMLKGINYTLENVVSIAQHITSQGDSSLDDTSRIAVLLNHLQTCLEHRRESHPSFKLMAIDNALFPAGIPRLYNIEAANDVNEIKTVREIVEDSWNRGRKNHLMIEGEGGIGKTVTLLSLPNQFMPHEVPTVYIQLHELKGVNRNETIEDYIKEKYFPSDDALFNLFLRLADEPWDDGPRVLLLLDGFNEIAPGLRYIIGQDINRWSERNGVQIATSSRYDIHSYVPLSEQYSRIALQPLSRDTIKEYLYRLEIEPPISEHQWKILDYPLMLTLYAQTEKAIHRMERDYDLQAFKENNSTSSIIWNYLQREIWRFRQNQERVLSCIVSTEIIAPFVAWCMQKEGKYALSGELLEKYVDDAYSMIHKLDRSHFPPHIRKVIPRGKTEIFDIDEIHEFIEKELYLFVKRSDGSYSLMHQQFRDVLAAIHLINTSFFSDDLSDEWNTPVDYYVMSFVAELNTEEGEEADRLWEKNRCSEKKSDISIINMLELQRRTRDYDFSELNFSGLNLSNISLYPYRVPGTSSLVLPHKPELNKKLCVSEKTFYPEGHTDLITILSITSDGKHCVSASADRTIRVWDLETGRCIKTIENLHSEVSSLSITPGCKRCVIGYCDGTIRVWDLDNGQCLKTINVHPDILATFDISPDGNRCVCITSNHAIYVWDIDSDKCLKKLKGRKGWIQSLSMTPDGRRVACAYSDGTIQVWDINSGQRLMNLKGYPGETESLSITPDGKRCISGSDDGTIRVFDIDSKKRLRTLDGHSDFISSLSITPDGKLCISGSFDRTIRVWDINTGRSLKILEGYDRDFGILSVTPDGKRCVSGSGDCTIQVWDIYSEQRTMTLEGRTLGFHSPLSVSPDGKRCVSGALDCALRVWDIDSGRCMKIMEGHRSWNLSLVLTPDGKRCISGYSDGTIQIWEIASGHCLLTLKGYKNKKISLLASPTMKYTSPGIVYLCVTPDGKRCVSGSMDSTLRVWDIDSGKNLITVKGYKERIVSMAITPDSTCCFCGYSDGTLRAWDIVSGKCLKTHIGEEGEFTSLSITPDGKHYVSGSKECILRIRDINSGQCLKTVIVQNGGFNSQWITPDGNRSLSVSSDGTLKVWDIDSGLCLKTVEGHSDRVRAIAFGGKKCVYSIEGALGIIDYEDCNSNNDNRIQILPVFLKDADFTQADVPENLKKTLWRNGASF